MSTWDKISLSQFQQIDAINNREDLIDIDKVLFSTCVVFNITEFQLDNMEARKALKLTNKVTKIFSKPFNPEPFEKIGKFRLNYDPGNMRFGQYMELSHYLSTNPINTAHNIMASISTEKKRGKWVNDSETHNERSNYFLAQPIGKVMGSLSKFIERFAFFNKSYQWLFGLDSETHGEEVEVIQVDPFNKKYGWMYSAEQVATYERISLDAVYAMNVRHVFNDLAYLKAKGRYETEQLKKK